MGQQRIAALIAIGFLVASAAAASPNIVLIVADDLGYGDLGSYGHPTIRTPNLDRLAAEGISFQQFYSASSVCSPSRAALMTGRLPVRFGLNAVLPPITKRGMPASEVTLGEIMRSAGYVTACVGKWHLGGLRRFLPTENGFDQFFGLPYSNDMSPLTNTGLIYRLGFVPPLPLMRGTDVIQEEPDQADLTRRYTEESVAFIREAVSRRKPFFLYLAHTAPHPPLSASDRFRGKSERGLYGDVVEELDWSVGETLRALREEAIEGNTLVIFTSDNGPWLAMEENGGSAGLLREGKGSTWDGGVRVPLLARWPGRIPASVRSQAFVTMMDLLPTFASLAGAALPADRSYDGRDISNELFDGSDGREALLFLWVRNELRAVRKAEWKLHVVTNYPSNGTRRTTQHSPPLLYNVLEDPGEHYDVASRNPDVVRELLEIMERHKQEVFGGPDN
jgi:arylsulfatase